MFTYSIKRAREISKFHISCPKTTANKCTNMRDARAKLLFCYYRPVSFFLTFSLPSPSSLLELPKFCYYGNVTSHFSTLLQDL